MHIKIIPDVIDGQQALSCLPPTAVAREAAVLMRANEVGAVMVVDHGRLLGIVTERDLVYRLLARHRDPDTQPIADIMTSRPETLSPEDSALEAFEKMRMGRYRHLPVLRDEEVCGMVSIRDLYEALRRGLSQDLQTAESLIFGDQYGVPAQ